VSGDLTLVAGSTGLLGGKICDLLASQQRAVRALVRPTSDPAKVERLRALGADVVVGDIEQPETLGPAVAGATHVVTTASTFPADQRPDAIDIVERAGTSNLVDAAAAAGVRRFVHVSLLETAPAYPHQQAKLAAEAHLIASGMEYAILKPGSFADVWFSPMLGFDVAGGTVQIFGDGTAPQTWICTDDVARFAVWALDADEARNAAIELGGPDSLSQLDVVGIYEELLGKPLERRFLPLEELERMHAEGRTPLEVSLAGVMLNVAHGGSIDMRELCAASAIRPTPVREFAARQLAPA
jgi:NADH dehydrogenase